MAPVRISQDPAPGRSIVWVSTMEAFTSRNAPYVALGVAQSQDQGCAPRASGVSIATAPTHPFGSPTATSSFTHDLLLGISTSSRTGTSPDASRSVPA